MTVTGTSPIRIDWPTALPLGKKVSRASVPRIATGEPFSMSSGREGAPAGDLVAVHREEIAADPADVALLVRPCRTHAGAGELLERDAVGRLRVEVLPVVGVDVAQAEVGRLKGRRRAVANDGRRLDAQLVEAAQLDEELHRPLPHGIGYGKAAENRSDAQHDAQGLERGPSRVFAQLDPGVANAFREGAGEHQAACGSATSPSCSSTRRPAIEAIAMSWVTITIVLPWR